MERFDITVIGAGPAGVCAAVEAARCGMRVLLVENSTICGGMLKRGGLPNVGYFFARGKAIIGGPTPVNRHHKYACLHFFAPLTNCLMNVSSTWRISHCIIRSTIRSYRGSKLKQEDKNDNFKDVWDGSVFSESKKHFFFGKYY